MYDKLPREQTKYDVTVERLVVSYTFFDLLHSHLILIWHNPSDSKRKSCLLQLTCILMSRAYCFCSYKSINLYVERTTLPSISAQTCGAECYMKRLLVTCCTFLHMETPNWSEVEKKVCKLQATLFKPNARKSGEGLLISFCRILILIIVFSMWLNGHVTVLESRSLP